ncbi:fused MFS/spermidine synthase [Brachybacterium huguangmaarense]|uniref:Fused MFS/spermidine synthase n=1 Tax=Brachybacterium huguangmaarense TaxID=1652028 RepID=A0ABY6FXJ5_9MICO|nr:fused MFS/spermidine synthase [Brachybacterium huguangmaarense]UYG15555.1 fused MFS/spermidine synthase [Brachybacterium huguangmaarense]
MARNRRRADGGPVFAHLGPVGVPIPIPTGTARLLLETDGGVLVEVNGVPSSYQHPDPRHLVFEYMRWMRTAIEATLEARPAADGSRVLEVAHLGGGGCSLPRAVAADHPAARQVVIELDTALAEHARVWFDLPRSPALRIRADDAARALEQWRDARFDVLVRDVFAPDRTPRPLRSDRAAAHAARVLRPSGIYLVNSAGEPSPRTSLADEVVTLRGAFAHVGLIAEPGVLAGRRRGNSVLVASQAPLAAGIDRALRSDPVSVRLVPRPELDRLAAAGRVIRED